MREARLNRYVAAGHRRVQGWLSEGAMALVSAVDAAQKESGVRGNVVEIGVHHGRLFLLLYLLLGEGENALAIDLFEEQEFNRDESGRGDREAFLENVRLHVGDAPRLRVHQGDSLQLTGARVQEAVGGEVRLFSVDGGHQAEMTCHDLATAADALCEGGVAILDDYFNEEWPGVSEGVNRFFLERGGGGMAPFAIGGGKLFLAKGPAWADRYRERLSAQAIGSEWKAAELFGRKVICVSFRPISLKRRLAQSAAWQGVRKNPFGRALKKLASRYWANS